ncbi:355_t:CDS:2, partial [Funneliformis geosporum]
MEEFKFPFVQLPPHLNVTLTHNSNKKNVANVLCEWNNSAITIQISADAHSLIKGGNTPLHKLIPEHYKEVAADLRKYSLLFIEQLFYSHVHKVTEQLLNSITGDLHHKFLHSKKYYFDFAQPKKIPGKQSFILGWNLGNNQLIIGKLRHSDD